MLDGNTLSLLDEAKRVDTRDLIARDLGDPPHVSGKWNFYCCPFHSERTPSFGVNEEGYKCFGNCGKWGDQTDWFIQYHHLSFREALARITGKNLGDGNEAEVRRLAEERRARTQERLMREAERERQALEKLRKKESWRTYHDEAGYVGQQLWAMRGIPYEYQKLWELGYVQDYKLWKKEDEQWVAWWETPTLSIPVRGHDWEVYNVKHRLLHEPPVGKYRYEQMGIPAMPFICYPQQTKGPAFVLEGEIKAMVTCITSRMADVQFIGLPSVRPEEGVFTLLADYDPIYLILDPDAYRPTSLPDGKTRPPAAWEVIKQLGKERVRWNSLPLKIDDLILKNDLGASFVQALMRDARRAA